ncbi:glycosyltransferase family 2 protein [Neisseria sp. Dent CA1/247]|uniref:glycosyltransferase family 2 protein n=1 Tax=Neisseria sp. Dent CA1/247 TaxID=2912675 RepID=UPI001FD46BDE|nr:glycosyltransferase family A protein [Neisseria sp. Dent CA1/247]UOO77239.1 glycosyltransferase family 2 protein [Neisseria sp. Dent CA1/247]
MSENYLNKLISRRSELGGSLGAIDFLIDFHSKKIGSPMTATNSQPLLNKNTENINKTVTVKSAGKYNRIHSLSKEISNKKTSEEFDFLLEYAAEIRKLEMSETYIALIKYLLLQYKNLNEKNQRLLMLHVSNVLRLSKDSELINILFADFPEKILELHLSPKQIDELFLTNLQAKYEYDKNNFKYLSFDLHTEASDAVSIFLKSKNISALLATNPEYNCLFCNAALNKNEEIYKSFFNRYLSSKGLPQVTKLAFSERKNILTNLEFEKITNVMQTPLVSIIMSAFNAEDTIEYAIKSLINQSYKNIEILICDDGSSDNTAAIIKNIAQTDPRIKIYRSKKNQGTYNIRNEMIKKAQGEFITFQDSDDFALPNRISEQVAALSASGKLMCATQWVRIAPSGEFVYFYDDKLSRFCVVSTMIKAEVFKQIGFFRESLVAADTEFYEKAISVYGDSVIERIEKPLILGLWGTSSLTKIPDLTAENNGFVAKKRRAYSDITARQRILGKEIISDDSVLEVLKNNAIYRHCAGVERY